MIIAISGKIGSGKDTLGMMLQAISMDEIAGRYSRNFESTMDYVQGYTGRPNLKGGIRIFKFADRLKEMVALILRVPREALESNDFKNSFLPSQWNYGIWHATRYLKKEGLLIPYGEQETISKAIEKGWEPRRTVRNFLIDIGMRMRQVHPDFWLNTLMNRYEGEEHMIVTDLRFKNEATRMLHENAVLIRINRPGVVGPYNDEISENDLDDWPQWNYVFTNNESLGVLYDFAKMVYKNHILNR